MLEKTFKELVEYDVSEKLEERDGFKYLPWGECKMLLHSLGAEKVYFENILNPETNHPLFMTNTEFINKDGNVNRCYEVRVKVHIDDKEYSLDYPLMNGKYVVTDKTMSQQAINNASKRAFVKCVAIHTGLGFSLWLNDDEPPTTDLSAHDILKVKQRIEELITVKMQGGLSKSDIAKGIGASEKTLQQMLDIMPKIKLMETSIRKL